MAKFPKYMCFRVIPYGLKVDIERVEPEEVAEDLRPVLLCKDCLYFRDYACNRWADGTFMEPTDFCSRGADMREGDNG